MKKMIGVTLIELMIVVAIIGVIAAFAYPSYTAQMLRGNRSDGMIMLTQAANFQERNLSRNGVYLTSAADVNANGAESENGFYNLTVFTDQTDTTNPTKATATVEGPTGASVNVSVTLNCTGARCFMMVASAKSTQIADKECIFLSIDNLGRKQSYSSTGALNAAGSCWN